MDNNRLHTSYTAEDIEQYFLGKLSPAAMHAMEKAALDDPFLSDAMDGYEAMKNRPWQKELSKAKDSITGIKKEEKIAPVIPMFPWKKAVAALLIITAGAGLTYRLTKNASSKKETQEIASINKVTAADSINKDTASTTVVAATVQPGVTTIETKTDNKTLIAAVKPIQENNTSNTLAEPSAKDKEQLSRKNMLAINEPVADSATNASAATLQADDVAAYKLQEAQKIIPQNNAAKGYAKESLLTRKFIAEVLAPDNTPLPYANVQVKQDNFGTYADVKGKFRLVSEDSLLTVEVSAAGYTHKTVTLKSGVPQNTIVLNEMPFADKEIVHFKNKSAAKPATVNRHAMQMDTVMDVEPQDGWSNYDTYLSNNLTPTDELRKSNIHGEVEVSFDVLSNGMASNVNIVKSLCAACDEEALRIIKAGPQWKVKKGKKEKGKVKVKF